MLRNPFSIGLLQWAGNLAFGIGIGLHMTSALAWGQTSVRLSLAEAVTRAAEVTAPVALAGLRIEEAKARVQQARGYRLPTVQVDAASINRTFNVDAFGLRFPDEPGVEHNPLVGPFGNFDARIHFSQSIYDAASLLRARTAREVVTGTTAEARAVAEDAAQRAALAYLRTSRANAKLAARQADAAVAAELLGLAEEQLAAGVSPGIDVIRARTQKVAADGQVLVAHNTVELAQIDLARAIGFEPGTHLELTQDLMESPVTLDIPLRADAALAVAVERRPELEQAEAQQHTAQTALRAIRAEILPRVSLIGDYGASGLAPSNSIATRQIGVQVSIPVFDGLRREARVAEQAAARQEGELRAIDLRQEIASEVQAALLELNSGQQQSAVADQQLALAEEELSQARERFTNGIANNLELISAQASLLRARDALIDARFTTVSAYVTLARATGMAAQVR